MKNFAIVPYSFDQDETKFMNGLWKILNGSRQKPIKYRYHFQYDQGDWKIYIVFVDDESFRIAKENYSAIANDLKGIENILYSNIIFSDA